MQINNNNSTSFGALKISNKAQRYLRVKGNDAEVYNISHSIKKAQQELSQTKKCNLLIEDDLAATIETPSIRFSGFFNVLKPSEDMPNVVKINTIYTGKDYRLLSHGADYTATFIAPDAQKATEIYEKANSLPYYERATEIAKFIDSVI